jgi:uncharacterized protein (TIGR02284 family)
MTTTVLPEKSLKWLQELTQLNIDSRDGFKEAAETLKETNTQAAAPLQQLAQMRGRQAAELQAIVAKNDGKPTHTGSFVGAARRSWTDFRASWEGGPQAVLSEAERREDYIKGKYEQVLRDLAGGSCATAIENQSEAVIASREQFKILRDRHSRR